MTILYAMNTQMDYAGDWFLPNSSIKLPGRLRVKGERIYLDLTCKFALDGSPFEKTGDFNQSNRRIDIIHGSFLRNAGRYTTLSICQLESRHEIGTDIAVMRYRIQYAFLNCKIDSIEKLLLKKAKIKFSNFSSWYDGAINYDRFSNENFIEKIPKLNQNESRTIHQSSIVVNDQLTIMVMDNYVLKSKFDNSKTEYEKFVYFNYSEEVSFDTLNHDCHYFSNLISLSFAENSTFEIDEITFVPEAYTFWGNQNESYMISKVISQTSLF